MSPPDSPSSTEDGNPPSSNHSPPLALLPPPSSSTATDPPAAETAATTSTPNPRRLPPPCWSHEETIALIDAYSDKWHSLRRTNLKAPHWQEVADEVAARCPDVSPKKTSIQCRHKMEKLRQRYRTEIQRARSFPIPSRFSSSWVHFKRMADMEKGPKTMTDDDSDSPQDADNDYDDQYPDRGPYGGSNAKTAQRLVHRNGIPGNSGGSGGFRIRIPTGVSIAQPGPRFQGKIDKNSNLNANAFVGDGLNYGGKVSYEEAGRPRSGGKRDRNEGDPIGGIAGAVKLLGDGYVRMEQMKMEVMREIEGMRVEVEMKRSEMILESQQRIVETFVRAMTDKKMKKKKKA